MDETSPESSAPSEPSATAEPSASAEPSAVAEPTSTPAARSRRRIPLIVGGAVLLVVIVVVAVILVGVLGAQRGPTQTVDALIQSIEKGDCELYVAVTTETFRESTITADDCEASGAFTGSGTIDYVLEYSGTHVTGETASVEAIMTIADTSMPDVDPTVTPITFYLVQESGTWKVDSSS
jgi:hypothetical protein